MMIPSALIHIPLYHRDKNTIGFAGVILVTIQCVIMIASIYPTEKSIEKNILMMMDQLDPIYRKMREKEKNNKKTVISRLENKNDYQKKQKKQISLIILELLKQVLQIHADIRPDIFLFQVRQKYTADELMELLEKNDEKPIYVAVDEDNVCVEYAFCQLQEQPFSNNMVPFKSLFIDDLCVSQETRGRHIGECLFEYVKKTKQKQLGCYEVTLNVWAGNTSAERFYEKNGNADKKKDRWNISYDVSAKKVFLRK